MHTFSDRILRNNVALVCLIILFGALTHFVALSAPFKTLDDTTSIIENPVIRSFANVGKIFTLSFFGDKHYYRPMVTLSFMTEYHFFGLQPFYYNLTNLTLHLATAVTVFFLVFLIIGRPVAFFTALLFAIHPIHWEAVSNIPGRAIILCAFFTVNSFFLYRLGQGRRNFLVYYPLSLLFFAGGLFSKESAAMLPILLASYIFLVERDARKYPLLLPYFLIIAVYMVLRHSLGIMETYPWRNASEYVLGFLTFLRASLTYVRLGIWPTGLHFDRAQKMFLGWSDPGLLETILAFILLGIAFFKGRRWFTRESLFFLIWFWIELFPVSQIITTIGVGPGYISCAEHFLYVPSIGMFVLLVLAVQHLYRLNMKARLFSGPTCRILLSGIVLSFMIVTVYQEVFSLNALSMLTRTLEYNPDNARILFATGHELVQQGRFKESLDYFRRALEREPANVAYRIAYGRSLFDQGRVFDSIRVYESVSDPGGLKDLFERNLKEAYLEILEGFQSLRLRDPNNPEVYYNLGTSYAKVGDLENGIEHYLKAIALKPDYKNALFNLGSIYEAAGRMDLSLEYFQRVFALAGPKDAFDHYACRRIAAMYAQRGEDSLAREWTAKALDLEKLLGSR